MGRLRLWDSEKGTPIELPELDRIPNTLFSPSLSADARWLAFTGWALPGASLRRDVGLFDLKNRRIVELPGLGSAEYDERRVALSGDGKSLAFTTNSRDGQGLSDLRVYHRETRAIDLLREANSAAGENYPTLNHDGSLVGFTSDRETGEGGQDVYVFDRTARALVPCPGSMDPARSKARRSPEADDSWSSCPNDSRAPGNKICFCTIESPDVSWSPRT